MATRKRTRASGNGSARNDVVMAELKLIHEEIRCQGARLDGRVDALTAEVRVLSTEVRAQGTELHAQGTELRLRGTELRAVRDQQIADGTELRAVRDLLVAATASDRRRIDMLETRASVLEAGKH